MTWHRAAQTVDSSGSEWLPDSEDDEDDEDDTEIGDVLPGLSDVFAERGEETGT